ncbi:MAG: hypothetical protein JWN39_2632 [Ilumatobacteraceae bacterium]|nr:hypothetical protein [Ilumatobacteraceae bacterium]
MDHGDLPTGCPRRIGWLVMGTESYGVKRITSGMLVELDRRGIELEVMSLFPGLIAESAAGAGLHTTVFAPAPPTARLAIRLRSIRIVRLLMDNVRVARRVRRQIKSSRVELLQLSDIELVAAARLATLGTRTQICYLTPNRPPEHRVAVWVFPRLLSGRRLRVLANSEDIRRRFEAVGVASTTLTLGIDVAEFTLPPGTPPRDEHGPARLVSVGRLCMSKAQDLWTAATIELIERGEDLTLAIVGGDFFEADFTDNLRAAISMAGVGDRIQLLGERSDVMSILADSDVALCGTREIEAFGLAAVEALSCERPVVVLGEGGIREIVDDGLTGWYVPTVDVAGVTSALVRCLADRPRWDDMGAAGREKVLERYTVERVIERYLAIVSTPPGVSHTSAAPANLPPPRHGDGTS